MYFYLSIIGCKIKLCKRNKKLPGKRACHSNSVYGTPPYRKQDEEMETGVQQQAGEKLIRILAFTLVISVMSATTFDHV